MNIYGLAITSFRYAASLKLSTGTSGALQACTPAGSTLFAFFLNWTTAKRRYKPTYVLCLFLLVLANLLYYLAEKAKDGQSTTLGLVLIVVSRVMLGCGGARMVTRKYFAIFVNVRMQSKFSVVLIAITALGLCIGPGLSALLEFGVPSQESVTNGTAKSIVRSWNILAFVLIFVWTVVLIVFVFFFKGTDLDQKAAE